MAAQVFSVSASTLMTPIENYWIAARTNTSDSALLLNGICITHISGYYSKLITYTDCTKNGTNGMGYTGIILLVAWYESVRLFCLQLDGKTEILKLEKVVDWPGIFDLSSQSQIVDNNVKVQLVHHHLLNSAIANVNWFSPLGSLFGIWFWIE